MDVNRQERKVYLSIFNKYDELIKRKIFWSFDYLEKKLINKVKFLAIVNAWPNKIDGWNYFKYYKMDIYILRDFDTFINLLENGIIKLQIKIGIHSDSKRYRKIYDHGFGFAIDEYNMSKLYYMNLHSPYHSYTPKAKI